MDCSLPRSPDHRISQARILSGLSCPSPGIFPTQGLDLHLLHWQVDSLTMNHPGSPETTCVHAQSCLTLCESMNVACQGSSVHGIFQARILEWLAIFSSRGSSQPRDRTHVSCTGRWILYPMHYLGSPDKSLLLYKYSSSSNIIWNS